MLRPPFIDMCRGRPFRDATGTEPGPKTGVVAVPSAEGSSLLSCQAHGRCELVERHVARYLYPRQIKRVLVKVGHAAAR